jgi:hypothetical protein
MQIHNEIKIKQILLNLLVHKHSLIFSRVISREFFF